MPVLQNKAIEIWYLFVFFSPLWIGGACKSCKKGIKFNMFFIKVWVYSCLIGMGIVVALEKMGIHIHDLIGGPISFLVFFLPVILGLPLFAKKNRK